MPDEYEAPDSQQIADAYVARYAGHGGHFTINATATYAVWPGQAFVCAKVSAPKYMQDQWYLGNVETGTVSVLVPYVYRGPR